MSSRFPKDGYLISLPLPSLVLDVQVTIGGKDAKVEYADQRLDRSPVFFKSRSTFRLGCPPALQR